jgi:predicted permease
MIAESFLQMLPILLVVLGGYLVSGLYSIKVQDLVKVVSDFFLPALIFISLTESNLSGQRSPNMAKASAMVCVLLFAAAFPLGQARQRGHPKYSPPLVS